jgi:hypothetical protein
VVQVPPAVDAVPMLRLSELNSSSKVRCRPAGVKSVWTFPALRAESCWFCSITICPPPTLISTLEPTCANAASAAAKLWKPN